MKKKVLGCILALALAVAAMFSFAGCGVSNTKKPDTDVDADDNKEASVFLKVGVLQKASERNLMQTWINAFQKLHPEVSITISKQYSAMDALTGYVTAKAMPDICWTAGDQHAPYSDPQNLAYFRNLAETYTEEVTDEATGEKTMVEKERFEGSKKFFAGFYDELIATTHIHSEDTGIWFVPRDYNRLVIYYNKTIFDNMGIATPTDEWTWQDFMTTCEKLTTKTTVGGKEYVCDKAIEWRNWAPVHYTMVKNFGGDYIDSNYKFIFDNAEGEACYTWYKDFIKKYATVGEGGSFGAYSSKTATKPSAAMMVDTYANLSDYANRASLNNWELNVAAFPNFVQADESMGYTGAGCSGYAITKACTDPEKLQWAWKFLQYCMSVKGYNAVAELGVVCPALKSLRRAGDWLNFSVKDTVINYNAYVAQSSKDLDVNFQGKLKDTTDQGHLVSGALKFWNDARGTSWDSNISTFKKSYQSATGNK